MIKEQYNLMRNLRAKFYFLALLCVLTTNVLAVDESTLLQPEEAFVHSFRFEGDSTLLSRWEIADGYYLYKDKIKLSINKDSPLSIGNPVFPQSTVLTDETFGTMDVFRNELIVRYAITGIDKLTASDIIGIKFQGCADVGVCYAPIRKSAQLNMLLTVASSNDGGLIDTSLGAAKGVVDVPVSVSEQDAIATNLSTDGFFLTVLSFFGFGLLLAFTPCVFPMIPILSGIIIGQKEVLSSKAAFVLSFTYVLAMALTYTIAGLLAAVFGTNLQVWFQNPWVISAFVGVFAILSLSMFGFYELQMPASIQNRLNSLSNKQKGGSLMSAGVMGVLSALIIGPCVTAPLVGALIYIGQTGNVVLGGFALFALGMGMGAPLLVIGTTAGRWLPSSGTWMEPIKSVFGVLMLGVAIWLLERILPSVVTQMLWAALLLFSGIYLGALKQHKADTSGWQVFWKASGLVMMLFGTLLMVGASTGRSNLIHPLQAFSSGNGGTSNAHEAGIEFTRIKGLDDLDNVLLATQGTGKYVMLDFYADWCISCKEMEALTFTDAGVIDALGSTTLLQADVTKNDEIDIALLKKFGIIGPPAILFFDDKGVELRAHRVVGYMKAEKFTSNVSNAYRL